MRTTVTGGTEERRPVRPSRRAGLRRRIVIALCLLLAGTLGAAGTAGYLTFVRPPANPPADACADGPRPGGRPVVVAAGASMTQGTLGADWVGDLRDRAEHRAFEFVNAGKNGDTSADLLQRLDRDVVACRPAAVTVLIGANDVRDGVPLQRYRDNLTAIVGRLKARTSARVALVSLPPIGEQIGSDLNRKAAGYNAALRETADRTGADYVPLNERMTDHLRRRGGDGAPYGFGFTLAFLAGARHYLLGHSWDEVARGNGLELLVDHLHLSDRGGAMVADLISEWLSRR
ncbi:SGNH/GDSL hydrolase family protein [Actinomadura kijaniata]|uniref:SGNH/GDSL hydrolase family protein n=1 Tax=Actinomadura kijaniata TaxID=46161 RepID=UPI00083096D7|nr:GDSL-type esterase/lipase family protein [Actinomadura kijaniata]